MLVMILDGCFATHSELCGVALSAQPVGELSQQRYHGAGLTFAIKNHKSQGCQFTAVGIQVLT